MVRGHQDGCPPHHPGEGREGLLTADPLQGLRDEQLPLPLGVPEPDIRDLPDGQSATRPTRPRATHVLLFVRRYKKTDIGGPQPWMLLGPADYVEHKGSKPMAITWDLRHEIPADVWTYSAIAAS